MKKLAKTLIVIGALAGSALLPSCATPFPMGCIYTKVTLPISVTDRNFQYNKVGRSKAISILGWVASGDASINKACQEGGIGKVSWVNQEVSNILGIYGTYTTVVYGYGYYDEPVVTSPQGE